MTKKSVLVVGASRGLGFAIVEELLKRDCEVTATCRNRSEGALPELAKKSGDQLRIETLDITRAEDLAKLKVQLKEKSFDVLFVNAGVSNANGMSEPISETSTDEFVRLMVTNALSPLRVMEGLSDLVRPGGVIGVMSSGQGSISGNESGGNDVYRASKAALNMLMRSFAVRRGKQNALLLLAPGWIKTEMGGPNASFTLEEVIPDIVSTILAQQGKPGLRYLDRFGKPVGW